MVSSILPKSLTLIQITFYLLNLTPAICHSIEGWEMPRVDQSTGNRKSQIWSKHYPWNFEQLEKAPDFRIIRLGTSRPLGYSAIFTQKVHLLCQVKGHSINFLSCAKFGTILFSRNIYSVLHFWIDCLLCTLLFYTTRTTVGEICIGSSTNVPPSRWFDGLHSLAKCRSSLHSSLVQLNLLFSAQST